MRKVIFYFDGYNLYYALRNNGLYNLLWLDLEQFCTSFLIHDVHDLAAIKFFTAVWKKRPRSGAHHHNYFQALRAHSGNLVKVIRGKFQPRETICPKCNRSFEHQEEKWTDVNLATTMLVDAVDGAYDTAFLVSADGDFLPVLKLVRERYDKEIRVLFPPGLFSDDLNHSADYTQCITKEVLERNQLPDPVVGPGGREFHKPREWNRPTP